MLDSPVSSPTAVFSFSVTFRIYRLYLFAEMQAHASGPFSRNYCMFVLVRKICLLGSSRCIAEITRSVVIDTDSSVLS